MYKNVKKYIKLLQYFLTIKNNEIVPLVATCMYMECITLAETSHTEKYTHAMFTFVCGI